MNRRSTILLCGFVSLACGCTTATVEQPAPAPPVTGTQSVQQAQREYEYALSGRMHRLRVSATVEFADGLCSGPGSFEAQLDGKVVHAQRIFVAYPATDACAATVATFRLLQA